MFLSDWCCIKSHQFHGHDHREDNYCLLFWTSKDFREPKNTKISNFRSIPPKLLTLKHFKSFMSYSKPSSALNFPFGMHFKSTTRAPVPNTNTRLPIPEQIILTNPLTGTSIIGTPSLNSTSLIWSCSFRKTGYVSGLSVKSIIHLLRRKMR